MKMGGWTLSPGGWFEVKLNLERDPGSFQEWRYPT